MKVFVTGASGHVGSATVPRLIAAGHDVTALARSESSANKLSAQGVKPIKGDLTTHDVLASAASEADAIIHLAFDHGVVAQGKWAVAGQTDIEAINAIGNAIKGTNKTFMVASGTLGLDGPAETVQRPANGPRQSEQAVFEFTSQGVRTIGLRFAPIVHSSADEHFFLLEMINFAKEHGSVPYVDDGSNVWPAVHVDDAADLIVLAVQPNTVPAGSNVHIIEEEGIPVKDIAEFIAGRLDLPTKSFTAQEVATKSKGFIAHVLGLGGKITNNLTREWTEWDPKGPKLFDDLENYTALRK